MTAAPPALPAARPVARILSDVAQVLHSAEDDGKRVRHALEQLGRLVAYDHCALLLARPAGGYELLTLPEPESDGQDSLRAALDRLLSLLADEPDRDRAARWAESGVQFPWRSHLAVPLIGLDRVIGVLAVGRLTPDPYGEEDLALLSIIASQLAAYRTALADLATRRHVEESLRLLVATGEVLGSSLDYETTLRDVARLAIHSLADHCVVDLFEQDGSPADPVVAAADAENEALLRELRRRYPSDPNRPDSPVARALRAGEPVLVAELPETVVETWIRDPRDRELARRALAGSVIAVPLLAHGRTLGVITFASTTPGRYGTADVVLAQQVAHRAALAIDNARLHRELQKQVELHLQLNSELRRLADERDELHRVAEERTARLEDLDRLKEEFIATASHDLKSPLTSIRGYAQLLLRRVRNPAPDPGLLAQGLAVIDAQTAALARLVDGLLDASRIQTGAFEPRTAPCELGECLDTVLAHLSPQERERVDVALGDPSLAGEWERKRVEQVLANLVGNALKYSPESERVGVVVERRPGEIEVAVGDRGMGISPEELPRLFERFHRTPQAHASGLPGTGLGLYICRGIIAAHGGRIWAESPGAGQGATFRFTLPERPPERGDPGTPHL